MPFMSEELEVLKDVAEKLDDASVKYLVSGSVAMNFYAQPRMTRDIDIVVALKSKDVGRFVNLFDKVFYIERETVLEEVLRRGVFNIIHNKYIIKIDFIVQKDDEFSSAVFERRKRIEVDKIKIWVISPEDLVLSKLLWAKDSLSEMQLRDVRNILDVVKDLDLGYINMWVEKLGLKHVFEKARQ